MTKAILARWLCFAGVVLLAACLVWTVTAGVPTATSAECRDKLKSNLDVAPDDDVAGDGRIRMYERALVHHRHEAVELEDVGHQLDR